MVTLSNQAVSPLLPLHNISINIFYGGKKYKKTEGDNKSSWCQIPEKISDTKVM